VQQYEPVAARQYQPLAENEVEELWQSGPQGPLRTASPDVYSSASVENSENTSAQQLELGAALSHSAVPLPLPPPGFVICPPGVAAKVGSKILYLWPEDGWQCGRVNRHSKIPPFSHVVSYRRVNSALQGEVDSLLDNASYGFRWVLLAADSEQPLIPPSSKLRMAAARPSHTDLDSDLLANVKSKSQAHDSHRDPASAPSTDSTTLSALVTVPQEWPCDGCGRPDREDEMVLCDACDGGWHIDCLSPALTSVPVGEWFCPACARVVRPLSDAGRIDSCEVPACADSQGTKLSALVTVPQEWPCDGCGRPDREDEMVLCDACDGGWHIDCLSPALTSVPVGEWFCPACAVTQMT
jgi:hypothetical protein